MRRGSESATRRGPAQEVVCILLRPRGAVVTFLVRSVANLCGTAPTEEVRMAALLSVEDVAVELGTTVRFVRRLVQERRIRFHKIGKYVRIAADDLEAFIADGRVDPDPAVGPALQHSRS
jgi:excisionase family DNA binding protein